MRHGVVIAVTIMSTALVSCAALHSTQTNQRDVWLRPAAVPFPKDNQPDPARITLGKTLFFDPRLSGSGMISCATCHNPALGWGDGQSTAVGFNSKQLKRSTPTLLNTAYQPLQMWDGRKNSLEDQALGPVTSVDEMNLPADHVVAKLGNITGYHALFDAAYPGEGITLDTVAKAIASFERTLVSTISPFDRWRNGDQHAISDSAKRGFAVFNGNGNCALCHQGFNFTDNGFHNIGLGAANGEADEGRFAHRKVKVLKGAFKTPTLRDIALTAPYMHNGMYASLEEVVDHYDRGGNGADNLDANIKPLHLDQQDKRDLVAFMQSLTGPPIQVTIPALPIGNAALSSTAAKP